MIKAKIAQAARGAIKSFETGVPMERQPITHATENTSTQQAPSLDFPQP